MKTKILCPYCGAPAVCVPASRLFGADVRRKGDYLYLCTQWPVCDSYVAAHRHSRQPMGTLANAPLRRKRMLAHAALDTLRRSQGMEKWAVYLWLQCKLGLDASQAHIGMFNETMCERVIALCRETLAEQPIAGKRSTTQQQRRAG